MDQSISLESLASGVEVETEIGQVTLSGGQLSVEPVWGEGPIETPLGSYRIDIAPDGRFYVLGLGGGGRVHASFIRQPLAIGDGGIVRPPRMAGGLHPEVQWLRPLPGGHLAFGEMIRIRAGIMSLTERANINLEAEAIGTWARSNYGDADTLVRVSVGARRDGLGSRRAWVGGIITCHTTVGGRVEWHWGVTDPQGGGDSFTLDDVPDDDEPTIMVFSSTPSAVPSVADQTSVFLRDLPWEITAPLMERITGELAKRAL